MHCLSYYMYKLYTMLLCKASLIYLIVLSFFWFPLLDTLVFIAIIIVIIAIFRWFVLLSPIIGCETGNRERLIVQNMCRLVFT